LEIMTLGGDRVDRIALTEGALRELLLRGRSNDGDAVLKCDVVMGADVETTRKLRSF